MAPYVPSSLCQIHSPENCPWLTEHPFSCDPNIFGLLVTFVGYNRECRRCCLCGRIVHLDYSLKPHLMRFTAACVCHVTVMQPCFQVRPGNFDLMFVSKVMSWKVSNLCCRNLIVDMKQIYFYFWTNCVRSHCCVCVSIYHIFYCKMVQHRCA